MLQSLLLLTVLAQAPATAPAPPTTTPVSARVWEGRAADYEEYLRTAAITRMDAVGLGVTHPHRAYFAPGGLARSGAFKPLPPGFQNGFHESYKAEIAAYELDKVLGLAMVPPTVERTIDGKTGAMVLWLEPIRPWEEAIKTAPATPAWFRQLARMKVFDDLIGNADDNKGNLLVDGVWNLFLIDHSRAFIEDKTLPWKLEHLDKELWDRVTALDEATLNGALGTWLTPKEIKAVLARRDKMKAVIDDLVKKNGARAVFAW